MSRPEPDPAIADAVAEQPATGSARLGRPSNGWLTALLPSFPLVLLILRLWYLGRQDEQTMVLLLQTANPLSLLAGLLVELLWATPALVLAFRLLSLQLEISSRPALSRSWLARAGARTPAWAVLPAAGLAALSWQLRFLPTLLLLILVISALEAQRRWDRPLSTLILLALVPAGLVLAWTTPAAWSAAQQGEAVTALLLVAPPLLAPILSGPLPAAVAQRVLPGLAVVVFAVTPLWLGARYLQTPVLPTVAVHVSPPSGHATVLIGELVSVDDRFTTLLDATGRAVFIPAQDVTAQVLCSGQRGAPASSVTVHGWHAELNALSWAAPRREAGADDPLCRGQLPLASPPAAMSTGIRS